MPHLFLDLLDGITSVATYIRLREWLVYGKPDAVDLGRERGMKATEGAKKLQHPDFQNTVYVHVDGNILKI